MQKKIMIENVKDIVKAFFKLFEKGNLERLAQYDMQDKPEIFTIEEDELSRVELIQYIVNVYIDGILCVFGFIGNSLAIYILQQDRNRNSNGIFLQAIAGFDILLLLFTVFYTILRSVYPATGLMEDYYNASPYIIAFVLPLGWIAQTGAIWFTMLVAGDRYLAISKPFKATTISTNGNAKRLTLIGTITAVIFNIPRFFHYYLVALHSDNNSTFVGHIRTELPNWNEDLYYYLYHITLTFIFLYIIPLSALVFFNIKLIAALKEASSQRVRLSGSSSRNTLSSHQQNRSITLNLVIVITKFIICQTPDFVAAIVGAAAIQTDNDQYKVFATFKEMLLVFNSAINFYIYLIFNVKFRQAMKTCCCVDCCRHCKTLAQEHTPKHSKTDLTMNSYVIQKKHRQEKGDGAKVTVICNDALTQEGLPVNKTTQNTYL